jgi:hypothetical protein
VLVDATVAAVLFGVGITGAGAELFQRQLNHVDQGLGLVREQLTEVSRATGNGVIEDDIMPGGSAVARLFLLSHQAQMVDLAAEALLQADAERGHE